MKEAIAKLKSLGITVTADNRIAKKDLQRALEILGATPELPSLEEITEGWPSNLPPQAQTLYQRVENLQDRVIELEDRFNNWFAKKYGDEFKKRYPHGLVRWSLVMEVNDPDPLSVK